MTNISQNNELKDWIKKKFITYIKWNDLVGNSPVGAGHFGVVYKTHWNSMNKDVVRKTPFLENNDAIQHEIQILAKVQASDNIIRFLGITQEPKSNIYSIVMEYADEGDLRTYLKINFQNLEWDKKLQLAFNIANGLNCLHWYHILHRDLHSKNVVIHKGIAKITDFGNSKSMDSQTSVHNNVFGILPYLAPELLEPDLQRLPYSVKTDIYSLGVLFWEISSGNPPLMNFTIGPTLAIAIMNGKREEVIPNTPYDYHELYTFCWDQNQDKRPMIQHVYSVLENMLEKLHKSVEKDSEDIKVINTIHLTKEASENQNCSDTTLVNLEVL
ncbi:15340_t:CDS:2 [Funneliformis mosseae]|uniref:15340_t:CDS:1 n=1 Tax=Funneliformis mosseae TaxID=27381 RepID=A0A9N9BBW9_FUNMO|nr:15340_t:CDS:2 [Funneliformis mosseae]